MANDGTDLNETVTVRWAGARDQNWLAVCAYIVCERHANGTSKLRSPSIPSQLPVPLGFWPAVTPNWGTSAASTSVVLVEPVEFAGTSFGAGHEAGALEAEAVGASAPETVMFEEGSAGAEDPSASICF